MEITTSLVAARFEPVPGASVAAPPDAAAMQRFAALMQAPAAEAVAPNDGIAASAAATPVAAAPVATGPSSVGDRILSGMQNVSEEFRTTWTRVSDTLRPDSPSLDMQQMLSLQLQLTHASVQYDLLGKLVSRSTQNLDQLVRVQ